MAELVFFSGTMDSGKSTLALQTHHNHEARGLDGLLYTRQDRAGEAVISSATRIADTITGVMPPPGRVQCPTK